MSDKRCSKCREWKGLECFSKDKDHKDKKQYVCKKCRRKYRQEHSEEAKKYRQKHKEEKAEWQKKYQQEHKEELKQRRKNYREERNQHQKIKLKTNPYFRLNRTMSRAVYQVKKLSIKRGRSWKQLVPYTLIELKKHLKRTLPEGYTWKDFMQGKLHIDHILPKAIFEYEKAEDLGFQRCWSLDNLRLLPAKKNLKKGTKLIIPFQKYFPIEIKIKE